MVYLLKTHLKATVAVNLFCMLKYMPAHGALLCLRIS